MLTDSGADVKGGVLMPGPGTFELRSETLGSLPVINHFLARMGMEELLDQYLPHDDARLRLAPARVIALVLRNLVVAHQPVYALGEWAAPYVPGLLGLGPGDAAALNDDRVGRMLDRLFDADWASLIHRGRASRRAGVRGGVLPVAQRLDHRHILRELPPSQRRDPWREGDGSDHLRAQQGPPA